MSGGRDLLRKKHFQSLKKAVAAIAVAAGVLAVTALAISLYLNEYRLEMSIPAEETIVLEYGDDYDDSDVTARYCGTIWERSGIEVEVSRSGMPDTGQIGEYTVRYTASYQGETACAVRTIRVEDHEAPVITLTSDPDYFTNPNDEYIEEGFHAQDNCDGDLTAQVIREEKDGTVIYTVADSSHNVTTVTREIVFRDAVAPVLTLSGEQDITIEAGESFMEPGYEAVDDCDGDITDDVHIDGNVDPKNPGTYELIYTVEDSSGNGAEISRTVTVTDTKAPDITLNGDSRIYIKRGSQFSDPGVTAVDACDGNISDNVQTDNAVDEGTVGVYTVKYTVSDRSGNQAAAERIVYVYEEKSENSSNTGNTENESGENHSEDNSEGESENGETNDPDEKIIYLTFDDGPGKYTEKLLDILDKYDVKVTFFVTNQYPKYQYLIGEEYKRGHTVAIHTYSHDYSTIYSSESAFYEDIYKMNQIIYEQTGTFATILRFPGGSSNAVSKKYCEGIMTALTESVEIMGFQYADWNVTSGDAGETKSTSKVISNVISGIKQHDISVVLQHDIHEFSVDAVEDIIVWGLENGYTFRAMDDTTQMVHHRVGN